MESNDETHDIWTAQEDLHEVAKALEKSLGEAESVKLAWRSQTPVEVGEDDAGSLLKLRSEEHTSELQSLMRISYAVFCLKKKKKNINRSIQQISYVTE